MNRLDPQERPYKHLIGLTEKEAVKQLKDADYIVIYGECATAEYVAERVKLWMKNDVVKQVTIG